jgi:uncharacterized integral membrane protein
MRRRSFPKARASLPAYVFWYLHAVVGVLIMAVFSRRKK